jgi:hypothetical protein
MILFSVFENMLNFIRLILNVSTNGLKLNSLNFLHLLTFKTPKKIIIINNYYFFMLGVIYDANLKSSYR